MNGVAERANRSIVEAGNALRHDAGADDRFWAESFATATYLRNRGPVKGRDKTPEELWSGQRPSVSHYKVCECSA